MVFGDVFRKYALSEWKRLEIYFPASCLVQNPAKHVGKYKNSLLVLHGKGESGWTDLMDAFREAIVGSYKKFSGRGGEAPPQLRNLRQGRGGRGRRGRGRRDAMDEDDDDEMDEDDDVTMKDVGKGGGGAKNDEFDCGLHQWVCAILNRTFIFPETMQRTMYKIVRKGLGKDGETVAQSHEVLSGSKAFL